MKTSQPSHPPNLLRLKTISNYYFLALIGQGQYGQVFCAYDYQQQTLVAVKIVSQKRSTTQQFLRELRLLVSINHPHIVACLGLQHHNLHRYIVMDYCEGGSLRDLIEAGNLTWSQSLTIISHLLSGLEYIHNHKIIHCDLKPENILLTMVPQTWQAKIADFGIAKEIGAKNNSLNMGDTGSPAYMAPERFYGKYGVTSDLYAVGIILYELIIGERPFSGTPQELINAHLNQSISFPDDVPFILRSIISKALKKLPQHRFQSAQEMQKSLQNAKEVLKAEKFSLKPDIVKSDRSFELSSKLIKTFSQRIIGLAGDTQKLYLLYNQGVWCQNQSYESFNQVVLPSTPKKLSLSSSGCLIWTQQENSYHLFSLSNQKLTHLKKINSESLTYTINNQWLAIAYNQLEPKLEIIKSGYTTSWVIKSLSSLPTQLITLDNHHGVAIYLDDDSKTKFEFFNRRGDWYSGFTLNIVCEQLVRSMGTNYTLVGKEANSLNGLLINIKPVRVFRFRLPFNPGFILSQSWGYFFVSRQGEILAVDSQGKSLWQDKLTCEEVTAVTAVDGETIMLSSYSNYQSHGYQLKAKQAS